MGIKELGSDHKHSKRLENINLPWQRKHLQQEFLDVLR